MDRRPREMSERFQLLGVTILYGLGLAPLISALHGQVGLFIAGLFCLHLAAIRWPRLRPGTFVLALLTIAGGANVLDSYHSVVGQSPGTALLVTMLALKLLEARAPRDLRVLLLLFGFLLVVQFLFNESALLAAYLTALLVVDLALLLDMTIGAGRRTLRERVSVAATLAGRTVLMAAPLALLLFFFFPRLDAPLWDLGLESEQAVSGLKNWLEPGSIEELVVSGEDALRVRFDREPGIPTEAMYWRGPVLWHTDGKRWLPASRYAFPDAAPQIEPTGPDLGYLVAMEPTDQHWLIALDLPTDYPDDAVLTPDFQVLSQKPVDDFRVYRMTSAPSYRTTGLSLDEETAALALPDNVTPRMRELVGRWTVDDPPAQEVVERALRHFNREPFRYTLLPPKLGENMADSFLFETRSGFCEHYASTFALLMRIAGVPSRIVLGYLGGEYNPLSRDYVVRQSDAHAWTEVWIQERGWVRIDPTAAVAAERVDADSRLSSFGASRPVRFRVGADSGLGRALRGLRMGIDALEAGWKNWVIEFSDRKQQRMLDYLGLAHLRQYGLILLLAIGGSVVMLSWNLFLARPARTADPVQRAYELFSRRLSALGLGRRAAEGPLDYSNRIVAQRPDLAPHVEAIVRLYLRLRYAGEQDGGEQIRLQRLVDQFRPRRR
ncbi:MAG: DUF3488 and transglutaminase-like domain-containing protein [Thiohalocapsa sp.]|nr:DUF3488 and transglutaminase-like domain-containing protein [Thiohalocapsa sp.]